MSARTWTARRDADGRREYVSDAGDRITTDGIPSWPFTLYRADGSTFIAHRLYIAKAEAGDAD
jgi:hypothetical protein